MRTVHGLNLGILHDRARDLFAVVGAERGDHVNAAARREQPGDGAGLIDFHDTARIPSGTSAERPPSEPARASSASEHRLALDDRRDHGAAHQRLLSRNMLLEMEDSGIWVSVRSRRPAIVPVRVRPGDDDLRHRRTRVATEPFPSTMLRADHTRRHAEYGCHGERDYVFEFITTPQHDDSEFNGSARSNLLFA
jgi:hypothetical protein